MARVPTDIRNRVNQSGGFGGFSRQQATPEQFGAASARATQNLGVQIGQAGDKLDRTFRKLKARQDDTAFNRASLNYDTRVTAIMFGDGTKENPGLVNRKGQDALDNSNIAMEQIDGIAASLISDPDISDEVRERLTIGLGSKGNRHLASISKFAGATRDKFDADLEAGLLQGMVQDAVQNRTDVEAIATDLAAGTTLIKRTGAVKGEAKEVTEQRLIEFVSGLHIAVINSYGQSYNVEDATEYFNAVRDQIDPTLHDNIQKTINSFATAKAAEVSRQRAANAAALKAKNLATSNEFFGRLAGDGTLRTIPGQLTAADVLASDLPALGPGGKREWLKLIQEGSRGQAVTNPEVFNSWFDRIHLPDGSTGRVENVDEFNAALGKGLTLPDIRALRQEFLSQSTPQGQQFKELRKSMFRTSRNQITSTNELTGIRDPKGEALYQGWLAQVLKIEAQLVKDKKISPEHYDPASPKFIGNITAQFKRSPKQMLLDMKSSLGGGTSTAAPAPAATASSGISKAAKKTVKKLSNVEANIASKATSSATGKDGRKIYLFKGVWVFGNGRKVSR